MLEVTTACGTSPGGVSSMCQTVPSWLSEAEAQGTMSIAGGTPTQPYHAARPSPCFLLGCYQCRFPHPPPVPQFPHIEMSSWLWLCFGPQALAPLGSLAD